MKRNILSPVFAIGSIVAAGLLAGCASGVKNPSGVPVTQMNADERGFVAGTGVESQDLVTITDKMARSILGIPEIAQAQGAPPIILLDPVKNNTRFPINKDIFLTRIRGELNKKANGKVRFVARDPRAAMEGTDSTMALLEREKQMKQAGKITSSSDPNLVEYKGGDYLLTGKFEGMTTKTSAGTSDYILYSFQLISVRTTEIVWEDNAEIKKQGLEDAAYR